MLTLKVFLTVSALGLRRGLAGLETRFGHVDLGAREWWERREVEGGRDDAGEWRGEEWRNGDDGEEWRGVRKVKGKRGFGGDPVVWGRRP